MAAIEHKNVTDLRTAKISKLLAKYYWPSFAASVIHTLYNIVDRIFIGQGVSAEALAGLSAVFPIMLIFQAFGMMIGMGASVRVSINLGKENHKRAEHVLGNALAMSVIFSIVLGIAAYFFKEPLLGLFGVSASTMEYANEYLDIILMGSIFALGGYSLNSVIRAEGNLKIAMYSMLVSAGLNIILDPIFIFVLDMGVQGAAWATIISQAVLFIWVLYHFNNKHSIIKFHFNNLKPHWEIITYIVTIGFAPFAMQLAASLVQATSNTQLVKYGGDLAVGSMGVVMSVVMLILMSIFALNMANQPIISFNIGANNHGRVKETLFLSLKIATVISTIGCIIVMLFPRAISLMFNTDNQEFISISEHALRIVFITFPIVGFQVVTGNYFQSVGHAGKAAFMSLLRQAISLIPMLLILPRFWNLNGVWLSFAFSDIISATVATFFLLREIKRLNRMIEIGA